MIALSIFPSPVTDKMLLVYCPSFLKLSPPRAHPIPPSAIIQNDHSGNPGSSGRFLVDAPLPLIARIPTLSGMIALVAFFGIAGF